jgi:hypothetical protein
LAQASQRAETPGYVISPARYKMSDFDVLLLHSELAVANFIGVFVRKDGNTTTTLRVSASMEHLRETNRY